MKIINRAHVFLLLALTLGFTSGSLWAAEDGLGTNVVRNLRVATNGTLSLGSVPITNWNQVGSTSDVGALRGATNALNYQVTNVLYGATNALNTSATNVSYQVTNILYGATNALNTAVTNLNARTNAWNNGVVIKKGSGTIDAGKLYYMDVGSAWTSANAVTNTTAKGLIGLALATEGAPYTNGLLLNGQFTTSHLFGVGATLYMDTNACLITTNAPFRTNHVVRIVGYAIDASTIMFNPDRTYIEILGDQ